MGFDVGQFRAQMVGDGARPNLFEVIMPFPQIARVQGSPGAGAADQKFTFMCRTSQLPGSTLGAVPVNYFGREIKLAGNRTFPEWTVTILNDEDFLVRNTFEKWMNSINSHRGNFRAAGALSPSSYTADPIINHYGKEIPGPIIKQVKLIGCFPIDVSPIDLDWGQNDTIEEFSVTLAFQWTEDQRVGIL
jgi:hypothetical protein